MTVSKASIVDDVTKLVSVAFLYSREVVRNLPLLYSTLDGKGFTDLAGVGGMVPSEYANIILDSSGVAALNLEVLIATPVACFIAWILVLLRLRASEAPQLGNIKGRLGRMHALSIGLPAAQLYRCADGQVSKRGPGWWSYRSTMAPIVKDIDRDNALSPPPEEDSENGSKLNPYVMPELLRRSGGGGFEVVMRPDLTGDYQQLPNKDED